jgi:hypothetical protein
MKLAGIYHLSAYKSAVSASLSQALMSIRLPSGRLPACACVAPSGYSAGVGGAMEGAGPLIGHSFCWEHRTFEVTDHFEVCAPSPILKEVVKKLRDATVKCQRLCDKLEHHLLMLSQQQ